MTPLLESVVKTKKPNRESGQRAHAIFEMVADPSGPDLGLNLTLGLANKTAPQQHRECALAL